jgi:hypothetical protein
VLERAWSGFSKKAARGQITSSWTSQFVNAYGRLGDQTQAQPLVQTFFEGDDEKPHATEIASGYT